MGTYRGNADRRSVREVCWWHTGEGLTVLGGQCGWGLYRKRVTTVALTELVDFNRVVRSEHCQTVPPNHEVYHFEAWLVGYLDVETFLEALPESREVFAKTNCPDQRMPPAAGKT